MPKSHSPYPPEFRQQLVKLVRSGRTTEELSKESEPSAQAIRNSVQQTERDAGRRHDVRPAPSKRSCAGSAGRTSSALAHC